MMYKFPGIYAFGGVECVIVIDYYTQILDFYCALCSFIVCLRIRKCNLGVCGGRIATLREIFQYALGGIHLPLIQHFAVYLRKDENFFRKI